MDPACKKQPREVSMETPRGADIRGREPIGRDSRRNPGLLASARSGTAAALNGTQTGAFSLVELLMVLVILGVLAALWVGPARRVGEKRARENCALHLRQMFVALELYARDFGGRYPALPTAPTAEPVLSLLVPRYTTDTPTFVCPASGDPAPPDAQPFASAKISYAYYQGRRSGTEPQVPVVSDEQVNAAAKMPGDPVFSRDGRPPGNNHGQHGGNVLFADGSVRFTPPAAAWALPLGPGVELLNPRP
jgi:prepilin-type N-terminal cleavage/methylation domain-containing protein/prepilin-type processing-associated H-X9-DG protein